MNHPENPAPGQGFLLPSSWVARYSALILPGGKVLDLACGSGRHSFFLADRGFKVVATDIDVSAITGLDSDHRLEILPADLEDDSPQLSAWPFPSGSFAGIIVTNYLYRPLFPLLADALSDNGILIIETFAKGNERFGKPSNPRFLLEPGELLAAFSPILNIVAYQHGIDQEPHPAVRQRLCARKGKPEPVCLPTTICQGSDQLTG